MGVLGRLGRLILSEHSLEGSGGGDRVNIRRSFVTALDGGGFPCKLLIPLDEDKLREQRLEKFPSASTVSFLSWNARAGKNKSAVS